MSQTNISSGRENPVIHVAPFRMSKDYAHVREVTAEHIENLDHGIAVKMIARVSMSPEALLRKEKRSDRGRYTGEGILYSLFRGLLKQEVFHYGKLIGSYSAAWCYLNTPWTNEPTPFGEPKTFGGFRIAVAAHGLGPQYMGFPLDGREKFDAYSKAAEDYENYERSTCSNSSSGCNLVWKLLRDSEEQALRVWLPADLRITVSE